MTNASLRALPIAALTVASAASAGFGVWLTLDKLTSLEAVLVDGTATVADVYVGQSWVVFAAALVGAGLVGLFAALAVWANAQRRQPQTVTAVQPVEAPAAVSAASEDDPANDFVDTVSPTEATSEEPTDAERAAQPPVAESAVR